MIGLVGSIIGGVANLVGQSMANKTNYNNQQMANQMSLKIARENNQFNAEEAQKARDWLSYSNQRKLMEEAGLNPALMFGDGNLSASSASASASGNPTFGAAVAQNPLSGFNFSDVANSMKALAEAKKIGGVDTEKVEAEINNIIESTEGQRISNSYAGKLNDQQLKQGAAMIDKIYQETSNLVKQGKLIEAEEALTRAQEEVQKETKRLTGSQADYANELASLAHESLMADINLKKSQANYNDTQSAWLPYQAKTGRISANASAQEAYTHWQEYNNPRDLQGAIIRKLETNPEGAGDIIMDVIENVSSSMLKRLDSSAKKMMLDHLKKDVQDYDAHPEAHTWFNDFIYDGKRRRIQDLENGSWHR